MGGCYHRRLCAAGQPARAAHRLGHLAIGFVDHLAFRHHRAAFAFGRRETDQDPERATSAGSGEKMRLTVSIWSGE